MKTIRGNFPPEKIQELVEHTKKAVSGQEPDHHGLAIRFWSAVTYSLFESIFAAFLAKSKHGADELGGVWKDLDPKTKAYSRPDARSSLRLYDNRAVRNPQLRVRPTLPPAVNRQWGGRWLGLYMGYFVGADDSKQMAAESTWSHFKALGYPTLYGLTKDMKLPLLNRTGALQRSLFPSPLSGGIYVPLDKNQIFRPGKGRLEIGTKRPGVIEIDKARPLWPEKMDKWMSKASAAGRDALYEHLPNVLMRI